MGGKASSERKKDENALASPRIVSGRLIWRDYESFFSTQLHAPPHDGVPGIVQLLLREEVRRCHEPKHRPKGARLH